jgi:hypothetical protein
LLRVRKQWTTVLFLFCALLRSQNGRHDLIFLKRFIHLTIFHFTLCSCRHRLCLYRGPTFRHSFRSL